MTLLLREEDVRAVLGIRDAIPLMEEALRAFSTKSAVQPLRAVVPVAAAGGFLGAMPAFLSTPAALGAKLVTFFPRNEATGLPTHLAVVLVFEADSGRLEAILDGRWITEARTAAVSAAATKALARPGARSLAILGSGVQAGSHVEAMTLVRPIERVRVWSRTPENARRFAETWGRRLHLRVDAVPSAREAVEGADLVVTATSAREPVLRGEWLAPGAHVNGVGACRPDWRELDTAAVARARLYVDSRDAALVESGDLLLPIREGAIADTHVVAELGSVLAGRAPGRGTEEEVTVFKSLGLAVEDVAAARFVVDRAVAGGLGERIAFP
ncbi:MAG TPA: ornithine cyclodeaminase family protein [Planctomycetota bacterium]|jgi:ornithine cyclodeaminase|nr:ornithine cyclodeaminase family protein [Planctomycetota bacterium]